MGKIVKVDFSANRSVKHPTCTEDSLSNERIEKGVIVVGGTEIYTCSQLNDGWVSWASVAFWLAAGLVAVLWVFC